MIELVLKWLFVQYNKSLVNEKSFKSNFKITGIKNPIEILRDQYGIPHIYAETNQDLMFAQGWVHAQDRLWQMEMNRRIAMGTISEVFGEVGLETDRLVRTLGFNRLAKKDWENVNSEVKILVESYSNGVNDFISKSKFPIEFKICGFKPDDWNPIDSLGWGRVMAWTLSHGWSGSITRQKIIDKVGSEKASELSIYYPDENPVELPNGLEFNELSIDKMYTSIKGPFLTKDMEGGGRGSNAWTVSASNSSTGRPILCNDTHLVLSTPGVWYLNHLYSNDGIHVTGASLPGLSGILIGHNENIAWGITLAYLDVEDIFIEKVDATDKNRYIFCNKSIEFNTFQEVIKIKNKHEHIETVKTTIHGPIIGDVIGNCTNKYISLSSKALDEMNLFKAIYDLNSSRDLNEFSTAVDLIKAPQLNFVFSDIKGNIGLFVSGRVPIRKKGNGQLPVKGWTGEYEWIDEIPMNDMPKSVNPRKGFLISCNNKIIDESYPYFLSNSYMNGFRAKRINDVFSRLDKISFEECKKLHCDFYSLPAEQLINGMIKGMRTSKPKVQKIIDILSSWDYKMEADSKAALVYQVLIYKIIRNLVEQDLGKELTDKYMGLGDHPILIPSSELLGHTSQALFNILQNRNSKWISSTKEIISLFEKSMISTCKWIEDKMGYDSNLWKWGDIHHIEFRHNLSLKPILRKIFNLGPFPIGGDTDTVCQTAYNPSAPYHATEWCPSIRMIIDVGDWDNSLIISPPGQSGVLGSKYYSNMTEKWIKGEYVPMLWDKNKIKLNLDTKIILIPE